MYNDDKPDWQIREQYNGIAIYEVLKYDGTWVKFSIKQQKVVL